MLSWPDTCVASSLLGTRDGHAPVCVWTSTVLPGAPLTVTWKQTLVLLAGASATLVAVGTGVWIGVHFGWRRRIAEVQRDLGAVVGTIALRHRERVGQRGRTEEDRSRLAQRPWFRPPDRLGSKRGRSPANTYVRLSSAPLAPWYSSTRPVTTLPVRSRTNPVDQPLPAPDAPEPSKADAEFLARRAAARLETAQLDAASADLDASLRLEPAQPTTLALQALVALGRADHEAATRLATAATATANTSADAWLALSYAQKSVGDSNGSMASTIRAAALEPNNALVSSRLAWLSLANGDFKASIANATAAARLAPDRAEPVTVLGFAYLSRRLDSAAARAAFDRAVELEPSAPLPRLGRGLAMIQGNDFAGGRKRSSSLWRTIRPMLWRAATWPRSMRLSTARS